MQSIQLAIWVVAGLVAVALIFDFMNGFHDAANSIATVVSTGVLKPQQAVAFAAAFNVVAYFVFHLKVAATVGKGTIDPNIVDHYVIFGALVGRDRLEHHHLVLRHSVELVARADRRPGGRGARQVGLGLAERRRPDEDGGVHLHLAAARLRARLVLHAAGVVDLLPHAAAQGRPALPAAATGVGRACTASATAATTRRKPSASSGCC